MIHTKRLILRQWQENDIEAFTRLNADPVVMQYFPRCLNREESEDFLQRQKRQIEQRGWGLFAVEEKSDGGFIGFVGLQTSWSDMPFPQAEEIGWRLAKERWGEGLATEAAKAVVNLAFTELHLHRIISFTSLTNLPSQAVMQRLHMRNTFNNFHHPKIPETSPLSEHVLYELTGEEWQKYA